MHLCEIHLVVKEEMKTQALGLTYIRMYKGQVECFMPPTTGALQQVTVILLGT